MATATAVKETKKQKTEKAQEESQFFVVKTAKKAADTLTEKFKTYNEKYVTKYVDSGRDFLKDMEKNARKRFDEMVETGKKYKSKVPMADKIEKRITDTYNSVKSRINLPTKDDINKLTLAMDKLTTKVDELNRKYSV